MEAAADFTLDFSGEDQAKASPNEGGGFKRMPFGDYPRLRIVEVEQQAKQGDKPHVMLKVTVAAVEGPADGIGMQTTGLYAGSRQSPKFMQDRLANLLRAIKLQLSPGQALSRSMLIGREFAGTITWELSAGKLDETTGQTKRYVNARLLAERPVGSPASKTVNAEADSREAIKYLEEKYGNAGLPEETEAAPWTQPATTPAAATAPEQPTTEVAAAAPSGFRPEAEADANVHTYRAYVKLGGPTGEQARAGLIGVGFDPDGPVDAALLAEPVKSEFLKRFPPTALGGLPPLGGAASAATPQKGKRAARTS